MSGQMHKSKCCHLRGARTYRGEQSAGVKQRAVREDLVGMGDVRGVTRDRQAPRLLSAEGPANQASFPTPGVPSPGSRRQTQPRRLLLFVHMFEPFP